MLSNKTPTFISFSDHGGSVHQFECSAATAPQFMKGFIDAEFAAIKAAPFIPDKSQIIFTIKPIDALEGIPARIEVAVSTYHPNP